MTKQRLAVNTPAGTFTRTTATKYTHAVVWNSPRAAIAKEKGNGLHGGVRQRWIKDNGFGVTWHGSETAANAAARKGYLWDSAATLVGVFSVAD